MAGTAIDVRRDGVVVAGVNSTGATIRLASLRADVDVAPSGRVWVTGKQARPDGTAALFLWHVRPNEAIAHAWLRDPADLAVSGTGMSVDPFGVSVVGLRGHSGTIWRFGFSRQRNATTDPSGDQRP